LSNAFPASGGFFAASSLATTGWARQGHSSVLERLRHAAYGVTLQGLA
jgi:hypothetical protein